MIFPPKKIFLKESSGKGMGVFALEPIEKGELIEVCHIEILKPLTDRMPRHAYGFPKRTDMIEYTFIAWGFGSVYNHSKKANIDWESDGKTMKIYAIKDIQKGEECLIMYHERYWFHNNETKPV